MADHVFSPSLLQRLKQASVEPGEVLVAVDPRLGWAAGVDPGDAMKVRIADGGIRAIGKQLAVYDAFDVGAFVCGPALFDAVEKAAPPATPASPVRSRCWPTRVARALSHRRRGVVVRCRHAARPPQRRPPRPAGHGKPLDGQSRPGSTAPSRSGWSPALLALFPRITPNQVTLIAFAVVVAAAAGFSVQAPIAAALLVALASVLDGSDGEVARLAYRSSPYGAFLDAVLDRRPTASVHRRGDLPRHRRHLGACSAAPRCRSPLGERGRPGRPPARELHDGESGHRPRPPLPRHLARRRRGRDLRLFLVTLGALAAAVEPLALLVALAAVALLCAWIVVVRLLVVVGRRARLRVRGRARRRARLRRHGRRLDGLPHRPGRRAARRRWASSGPRRPGSTSPRPGPSSRPSWMSSLPASRVASRFEAEKTRWMGCCEMFTDVVPAVERLAAAGVPVLLCSSTRGAARPRVLRGATGCSRGSRRSTVGARGTASPCSLCRGRRRRLRRSRGRLRRRHPARRRRGGSQARGSSAWSVQDTPTPSPAAAPRSWARCPSWPPTSSKPSAPR